MTERSFAVIIPAAGLSSRMSRFKPLLPLNGETITDHVITTFLHCNIDVILVVGHRHDELRAGIIKRDITIIENPDYVKGMFSSIQAGIQCLRPDHKSIFIMPVDIPLVREATIRRLRDAAAEHGGKIIYPTFKGKRGHPPLLPSSIIPSVSGWRESGGLKAALQLYQEIACEVPVADGNILFDIDTDENYTDLQTRFRRNDIPTDEECEVILNEICTVAPDRIRHDYKVAEVAVAITRALSDAGQPVDNELVRTGAILHDIAKGQPKHDIAGGRILRDMDFKKVGDIVAVHSTLADGDVSLSLEAKVVFLADKLIAGVKPVSIEERYYRPNWTPELQKRVLERREVAFNVKKEIEGLLGCPLEKIITAFDS